MPLSDPWLPSPPTPLMAAIVVQVYRVHTSGGSNAIASMESMPNLECWSAQEQEGPDPSTALFAYVFGQADDTAPQTIEDCLSTTSTLARVVQVGDRLAVSATRPDGTVEWLFDGYVYEWGLEIDGDSGAETVAMTAYGLAKECRRAVVGGALVRHADKPTTPVSGTTSNDVQTDEVAQFNPRGKPNATPSGGNSGTAPSDYPVFLDPTLDTNAEDLDITAWTLPMAARHLVFLNNPQGTASSFVKNPTGASLDSLLVSRQPIDGTPYDPTNASTYTTAAIRVPDTPLTGRDWPKLVHDLVRHYGFGMWWPITSDGSGYPATTLNLFLKQAGAAKSVWLPPRGSDFDPTTCNVGAARMSRDLAGVVNQWKVVGALKRYEVSVVLAPGFAAQASDAASASALQIFKESDPSFYTAAGRNDQYRLWVFDECGEGHYANGTATNSATIPTLDAVFGAGNYVRRRRRPVGELFERDGNGKPLRAQLRISTNYAGASPAAWDGTGSWSLAEGGWELLHDRLGVRLTCPDPNNWHVGKDPNGPCFKAGVVKAVQCMAAPDAQNPAFFLMLTVVIEGDQAVTYTAQRSPATSPLSQVIVREIDARDRYLYQAQAKNSWFNQTAAPVVVRDDSAPDDDNPMKAEGLATRVASESGTFEADPIEVPYFTRYYDIGDRIDQVAGRNLGLRTDTGGTGYLPVLPIVVQRRWELKGGQRTTLTLSDSGTHRKPIRSAIGVRADRQAARKFHQEFDRQAARMDARAAARKRFRDTYGVGRADGDFS